MSYADICPPMVAARIAEADTRSYDSRNLITWVEENSDRQCAVAALEAVAGRIGPDSDLAVIDLFCNAVASYARMLDDAQKAAIREAYLRIPYNPAISFNYFLGLRNTGIDIRDRLKGKVGIDWSFESPRRNAQTWDYYLYLARLGEPGALEALADKIAATDSGNDVTLLLMSLNELPGPEVTAVLERYGDDARTADGVSGPGLPISQNVAIMLALRGN
ncbi:hypothetical protein [Oceaniglobus roseus]|uniref:hypothetical protein n=1 Tax=Oceaniglobus roseus TaxID=1737570 RepID=UPI000C7F1018|nr:hypothetical protein [Kandeliimicrobium roseum]